MADDPTPACSSFAHFLGRPAKRANAKSASKRPIAVEAPLVAAQSSSSRTAKRSTAPAVTRPRTPEKKSRAHAESFSHLLPVEEPVEDPDRGQPELASQIVAAAARARTPTGIGVAKPTGLAAKILAAGRRRRGEKA